MVLLAVLPVIHCAVLQVGLLEIRLKVLLLILIVSRWVALLNLLNQCSLVYIVHQLEEPIDVNGHGIQV